MRLSQFFFYLKKIKAELAWGFTSSTLEREVFLFYKFFPSASYKQGSKSDLFSAAEAFYFERKFRYNPMRSPSFTFYTEVAQLTRSQLEICMTKPSSISVPQDVRHLTVKFMK